MKKFIVLLFLSAMFFQSCSRGITVQDAANGKARCGRYLR